MSPKDTRILPRHVAPERSNLVCQRPWWSKLKRCCRFCAILYQQGHSRWTLVTKKQARSCCASKIEISIARLLDTWHKMGCPVLKKTAITLFNVTTFHTYERLCQLYEVGGFPLWSRALNRDARPTKATFLLHQNCNKSYSDGVCGFRRDRVTKNRGRWRKVGGSLEPTPDLCRMFRQRSVAVSVVISTRDIKKIVPLFQVVQFCCHTINIKLKDARKTLPRQHFSGHRIAFPFLVLSRSACRKHCTSK